MGNEDVAFPLKNILPGAEAESQLASAEDAQLLIKISFLEKVRLRRIHIVSSDAEGDEETVPATVKLFINSMTLDFSNAESEEPLEVWNFAEDEGKAHTISRGGTKFNVVDSLQIFIEDNAGAEVTKIKHIDLFGQTVDTGEKHWSV